MIYGSFVDKEPSEEHSDKKLKKPTKIIVEEPSGDPLEFIKHEWYYLSIESNQDTEIEIVPYSQNEKPAFL